MDEDYSPKYEVVFDEKLNAVRVKVEDSFVTLIHSCMILKTEEDIQAFRQALSLATLLWRQSNDEESPLLPQRPPWGDAEIFA